MCRFRHTAFVIQQRISLLTSKNHDQAINILFLFESIKGSALLFLKHYHGRLHMYTIATNANTHADTTRGSIKQVGGAAPVPAD